MTTRLARCRPARSTGSNAVVMSRLPGGVCDVRRRGCARRPGAELAQQGEFGHEEPGLGDQLVADAPLPDVENLDPVTGRREPVERLQLLAADEPGGPDPVVVRDDVED